MTARRVQNQPAWLLHHRPFQDSSRILDILSRDYGRLSLVARGSRSAKSKLKGILRPFMPLQVSWVIRTDLGTLTGAELDGAPISLTGDSLLSAYYVNELLLNLMHRHDSQPEIFAVYQATIHSLNEQDRVAIVLRQFELELLRLLGYALNLDHDTDSGVALDPQEQYEYRVERGPSRVEKRDGPMVFSGAELIAVAREDFSDATTLKNASRLLRRVLAWHLDGKELMSRKVMREIRRGAARQQ